MRFVVTLVHGTWAKRAKWIRPDSVLSRSLVSGLGEDTVVLPFKWSGRNSFRARARAAEDLKRHLEHARTQWPDAEHFIVAHSHGGNVALSTFADESVNAGISGLVCLSTPFLLVGPRKWGALGLERLAVAGYLLLLFLSIASIVWIDDYLLPGFTFDSLPGWVGFLASLLFSVVYVIIAIAYSSWGGRFQKENTLPRRKPRAMLIIRTSGDEASGALVSLHFLSWLINRPWILADAVASGFQRTVERWQRKTVGRWGRNYQYLFFLVALICVIIALQLLDSEKFFWRAIIFGAAAVPMAIAVALTYLVSWVSMIVSILLLPFVIVTSMLLLPFGPGLVLSSPFVEIMAESTPPGEWSVYRPRYAPDTEPSLQLAHSRSYDNPDCRDRIVRWIRAEATARNADSR